MYLGMAKKTIHINKLFKIKSMQNYKELRINRKRKPG
jgi:hypothetical protein